MPPYLRAGTCLCLLLAATVADAQAPVVVYRCVDASGQVSLGDVPCAKGAREEVRSMQRPVDGEPLPAPPPAPPQAHAPASPHPVVLRSPQPMYECITPDGTRYTSETGDGNPRWVPLWTLGYGPIRGRGSQPLPRVDATLQGVRPPVADGGLVQPPRPGAAALTRRPPPVHRYGAGGTWVRDTCHALPQREVCSRLRDRRDAIRTRFFNAQERERDELRDEERGINARLAEDCGAGG